MRQKTWNFLLSQYSVPSFGGYIAKERAGIGMAGLDLFKKKKYNEKGNGRKDVSSFKHGKLKPTLQTFLLIL